MQRLIFTTQQAQALIANVDFAKAELIPAIAVQHDDGEILMQAWINQEALLETLTTGQVCYYSRSKSGLWRKGETSGHIQILRGVRLDCDDDCIMFLVEQLGAACHTFRRNCFFKQATIEGKWEIISQPII